MGLVMDDINSYTVNEFEQRCFYTRSFSKKETNKVLRKIMNIGRCDVYFN